MRDEAKKKNDYSEIHTPRTYAWPIRKAKLASRCPLLLNTSGFMTIVVRALRDVYYLNQTITMHAVYEVVLMKLYAKCDVS